MRSVAEKAISLLLVLTFILTMLPLNVFAAESDVDIVGSNTQIAPVAATYKPTFAYTNIITIDKTTPVAEANSNQLHIYVDGANAYCIEPKTHLFTDTTVTPNSSKTWDDLGDAKQAAINTALAFGLEGNSSRIRELVPGVTNEQMYVATQVIIWEIVLNHREARYPFSVNSTKGDLIYTFCQNGKNPILKQAYDAILQEMSTFQTVPSFAGLREASAKETTFTAYKEGGAIRSVAPQYLRDRNGVLSHFDFTGTYDIGNAKIKITNNDNNTIKLEVVEGSIIENATSNDIVISSKKKTTANPSNSSSTAKIITYSAGDYQDTVTGYDIGELDPPSAYIKIKLETRTVIKDAIIRKELYTPNEYDAEVEYGEGVLQQSNLAEGWYFYVEAPTNNYSNFESFILGPTNSEGYTQSFADYIKENIDSNLSYEVPYGDYKVYELGFLKDGEDGTDINNDYYLPDNIEPAKNPNNGLTSVGAYKDKDPHTVSLSHNWSKELNIVHAENEVKIPFEFRKVFRDADTGGEAIETYDKNYYFTATNKDTGEVYLFRSKSNGSTVIVNESSANTIVYLPEGTYTLHELGKPKKGGTSTSLNPDDYYIPSNMIAPSDVDVTISAEEYLKVLEQGKEAIEVTFGNTYAFPFQIIKTDADTGEYLAGAVFGVYADEACTKELEKITIGSDGIGYSESEYVSGRYYIKEISPSPNADGTSYYEPYNEIQYLYCHNGEQEEGYIKVRVKNRKYPSSIEITKVDAETNKPLEGAVFKLYSSYSDARNNVKELETLTTNSSGKAKTKNTYKPGTYYYKETKAPYGYMLDSNIYSVIVNKVTKSGVVVSVTRTNPIIKSPAELIKCDAEGNPLEGAEFSFYSDISCTPQYLLESKLVSDIDGYVLTKEQYPPGTYYFLETKAPDGYKPTTERFKVEIEYTDDKDAVFMAEKHAVNTENGSYLVIKKNDTHNGKKLNVTYGVYYNSGCTDLAETVNVIEGYGKTEKALPPGTYYIKESETTFGYQISTTVTKVVIPETNTEDNVVYVSVNNSPYLQTLSLEKTNANNGALLEGAVFQLRKPYENMVDRYLLNNTLSSEGWINDKASEASFTTEISSTMGVNGTYGSTGYGAMKLTVTDSEVGKFAKVYQDIYPRLYSDQLLAGEKYTLSARVRIDSLSMIYDNLNYGAKINAIFYYEDGTNSGETNLSSSIDFKCNPYVNNGFTFLSTDFIIPENLSYIRLELSFTSATGTVYFDDIRLTSSEYKTWIIPNNTTATINWESVPDAGLYDDEALKLTISNPTTSYPPSVAIQHQIDITEFEPDTCYTVSCYAKVENISKYINTVANYGLQIRGSLSTANYSKYSYQSNGNTYINKVGDINVNNGYVYMSLDFITPSETEMVNDLKAFIVNIVAYNCTGVFYFDDVKVYKNNKQDNFSSYKKAAWGSSGEVTFTNEVSTEEVLYGANSMKINTTACTSSKRARVYKDIYGLIPGETYNISAYVKVTDITPVSGQTTYGAVIAGTIFDTSGGTKDHYSSYVNAITDERINNGFQRINLSVKIPDNYKYLRLNLAFRAATGTVYFDEVRVESIRMVERTVTTDSNGYATFGNIYGHEYVIEEISAPEGYKFNSESRAFTSYLKESKYDNFLQFTNEPMDRTISLSKFDKRVVSYARKHLEGATYELYSIPVATSSHFRATATTNENGPVTFMAANSDEPFYVSSGETYYLRESKAPTGYMLDKNWYLLTVNDDSCTISVYTESNTNNEAIVAANGDKILGYNNSYSGSISLTKTYSEVPNNYAVAVFQLYNAETDELIYLDYNYNWNGDLVGMTQFNLYRNEKRTIGGLPPGKYYLLEVSTNGEGFFPKGTKIPFEMVIDEENQKCIDLNIVINNNKILLPMAGGEGRPSVSSLAMVVVATIFCGTITVVAVCPKRLMPCKASTKKKSYKIKK